MTTAKMTLIISSLMLLSTLGAFLYLSQGVNTQIEDALQKEENIVLYFSASWCQACKRQRPVLEEVRQDFDHLRIYEIGSDLDKVRKKFLFKKYGVTGLPTFILFKKGKEFERLQGVHSKEELGTAFSSLD